MSSDQMLGLHRKLHVDSLMDRGQLHQTATGGHCGGGKRGFPIVTRESSLSEQTLLGLPGAVHPGSIASTIGSIMIPADGVTSLIGGRVGMIAAVRGFAIARPVAIAGV